MVTLPVGIEVTQIADQPHIVDESVSEFFKTFLEALVIVLVVSFLSLGWRTGIVVALSVPLVLAIVFVVMSATGIDLHRITLGALIIALGLLVDDAIIAIEMMVVKMEQGWDRARAATFAWTSTAFPMLTGTLVTAAGFLPVGFAKSSAGEYAGGIFWIVGLALIASWLVAVVFTPYLGLKLLPDFAKHGTQQEPEAIYDTRIYRALRRAIEFALRWRGTVVAATVLMFVAAVAGFGLRPAAVLSDLDALGAVLRDAAAGRDRDRRHRRDREEGRAAGRRRSRRCDLHDLRGPGLAAVLARAQPGPAEPELRPDRHRHQGPCGARARQGAARGRDRRRRPPGGARARRPLRVRAAGRLPGAVPRGRSRSDEGAHDRRGGPPGHGGQSARSSTLTSIGASRSSRSASRSTRTAPARLA